MGIPGTRMIWGLNWTEPLQGVQSSFLSFREDKRCDGRSPPARAEAPSRSSVGDDWRWRLGECRSIASQRLDAHGPVPFSAFVGLGKKLSGKEVQGIQSEYGSFSHIDQSDTITAVLIGHHDD